MIVIEQLHVASDYNPLINYFRGYCKTMDISLQ